MASDLIRRCKPPHLPPFHLFRFLALAFPPPFFFLLQCFSSKLSFFGPVHSVLRFTDDESYHEGHGHAYSNYGIDPSVGCVVILRPDQYVSLVTDLSDHHGIGSSFFFFFFFSLDSLWSRSTGGLMSLSLSGYILIHSEFFRGVYDSL